MAFGSFQHCHRRTVTQFQIVDDAGRLQTAAAFCFSGLQQGLSYNGFPAAVAPAFPAVHSGLLSCIGQNRELSEPFSDKVFQRRMALAAAAFLIALGELCADRQTGIAAIAPAAPHGTAAVAAFLRRLQANELPEPLSGQVFHAGLYPAAAAVADRAPPQGAGIQSNGSAAVAAAFPDGVSVLSLLRGRLNRKLPDAKPNADARMRRAAHLPRLISGSVSDFMS